MMTAELTEAQGATDPYNVVGETTNEGKMPTGQKVQEGVDSPDASKAQKLFDETPKDMEAKEFRVDCCCCYYTGCPAYMTILVGCFWNPCCWGPLVTGCCNPSEC